MYIAHVYGWYKNDDENSFKTHNISINQDVVSSGEIYCATSKYLTAINISNLIFKTNISDNGNLCTGVPKPKYQTLSLFIPDNYNYSIQDDVWWILQSRVEVRYYVNPTHFNKAHWGYCIYSNKDWK